MTDSRRDSDKFMLRLPDGWRDVLKVRAARNRRSMNQEILAALESVVNAATGEGLGNSAPVAAAGTDALQGVNPSTQGKGTASNECDTI